MSTIYSNADFIKTVAEIISNGTMNMYVQEAIENQVDVDALVKEIKLAIKMHRKYDKQVGSSPLHAAVVVAMTRLLNVVITFK